MNWDAADERRPSPVASDLSRPRPTRPQLEKTTQVENRRCSEGKTKQINDALI